ncbi:hypothetical protein [Roseibium sp. MMSF_3544]|uniref:hypothetical protein n=1 Tax=unclassified Roseibium TaxID=2629323 RepID=UPI00273DE6E4|nr:hypothetical protein [Roseibium sp. MMSF_3544]
MIKSFVSKHASAGNLLSVTLAAAGFMFLAAQPADAQSGRPDSRAMSCAQVQSMVNQRGAVVLSTGRNTFDRYVANRSYCQHGEVARNDYVPSKDSRRCFVRRCVDPQSLLFFD